MKRIDFIKKAIKDDSRVYGIELFNTYIDITFTKNLFKHSKLVGCAEIIHIIYRIIKHNIWLIGVRIKNSHIRDISKDLSFE